MPRPCGPSSQPSRRPRSRAPTALVRRDSKFKKLELTDDDVATVDQIVDILVKHKQLLQRPVVVTPEKAIVGRPKERVRELLS